MLSGDQNDKQDRHGPAPLELTVQGLAEHMEKGLCVGFPQACSGTEVYKGKLRVLHT